VERDGSQEKLQVTSTLLRLIQREPDTSAEPSKKLTCTASVAVCEV
jgi:hypothetical protein